MRFCSIRHRALALLAPSALLLGVLSACGSSSEAKDQGTVSHGDLAAARAATDKARQAPTTIATSTPLTAKPPAGRRIAYLQDGTQPSTEIYAGLEEAAKALGWTASAVTFDPTDLSTLNAGLLQALRGGADYVVEAGFPESQLSKSTVEKFTQAGVPIVVVGTTPVPQTDTLLGDPGDQNARIWQGKALANWFVSDSEGRGKAVVVNLTTYPTLTLLTHTFTAKVKATCPSCETKTLEMTIGDALNGTLANRVISALRADRSIKYVLFDNSGEIAGIDKQLQTAGLDDVKTIGSGIDPVTVQSLRSGHAEAFTAFNFRYSGWAAVDIAARHSVGDPIANGDSIQPSQLISRKDVDQLGADAIFREPANGLKQFEKLWLVSGS